METRDGLKVLEGQNIRALLVSDDQHYLRFETSAGPLTFIAVGECSSESWFADLCGVQALLGARVTSVEAMDMPPAPEDGRTRQASDEQYGWKLVTTKGYCDLIFRNSSNGYYGGWLEGPIESNPYYEDMPTTWTPITEDWSA